MIKESGSPGDFSTSVQQFTIGATQSATLSGNPYRIYITMIAAGGTVWTGPGSLTLTSGNGPYTIAGTTTLIEWWWDRHRSIVTQPWVALGSGPGITLTALTMQLVPRG